MPEELDLERWSKKAAEWGAAYRASLREQVLAMRLPDVL